MTMTCTAAGCSVRTGHVCKPTTQTAAKITVRGIDAIRRAEAGGELYVFNPQRGWIAASAGTIARARRMDPSALWIYGVVK